MSTVSTFPSGKGLVAVKGAPETIKDMLAHVPEWYDETFKWYTRRGSRVLALGTKEMDSMSIDKVPSSFWRVSFLHLNAFCRLTSSTERKSRVVSLSLDSSFSIAR